MTKVAIIGFGGMGFVHYNAYKDIPDAKVIAVADVCPDMAKEKLGEDDVKVYSDMEQLLQNEKPDMVDICTPTFTHAHLSIRAMECGCHVLCEKPMSLSLKETKKMIKASEKYNRTLMVAHVVRFGEKYLYIKKFIDNGELGKLKHIDMKRISKMPDWSWENWMQDISKSKGCPVDMAIHDIDLAQYMLGDPEKVTGVYYKMHDGNDYITANMIYKDSFVTITSGWYSCDIPFRTQHLAIFEKGYIEFTDDDVYKNGELVDLQNEVKEMNTGINIKNVGGYAKEIAYFIDCINTGKKPECVMPESSQKSVKIALDIVKNSKLV